MPKSRRLRWNRGWVKVCCCGEVTEPRYLETRQGISNRVISANKMGDKNCVVVGSGVKEYGMNKMHNKEVPGSARSPNIHYCLVVAVKKELLSRPLMPPEKECKGRALATELIGP